MHFRGACCTCNTPRSATAPRQGRGNYCCVVNCHNDHTNTKGSTPPVKFYRFPNRWYEKSRRQAWITAVRRLHQRYNCICRWRCEAPT
uniref:THAP-type domain-containing protein n=1 Tax=Rhipicephalus appendiculatus TaxID=34631 RepID=A0A131Z387_RHIAP